MRLSLELASGLVVLGLAGCSGEIFGPKNGQAVEVKSVLPDGTARPVARPKDLAADDLTANAEQSNGTLGVTVVSLGTPSESGLWVKTPLVTSEGKGRVEFECKGIEVQLIPIDAEPSSGSRTSMHAMQALGIPLTDLVKVQVSAI